MLKLSNYLFSEVRCCVWSYVIVSDLLLPDYVKRKSKNDFKNDKKDLKVVLIKCRYNNSIYSTKLVKLKE